MRAAGESTVERRYRFAPPPSGLLVGGIPARVIAILIGGLLVSVGARLFVPETPAAIGFVVPLLLALGLALLQPGERPLERWLPLLVSYGLHRRRTALPTTLVEKLGIEILAVGDRDLAVIRQRLGRGLDSWSCVLELPGRDFSLASTADQAAFMERWGWWLAAQGRSRSALRRLQLIDRVMAIPNNAHVAHLLSHGDGASPFFDAYLREQLGQTWPLVHRHYLVVQLAGPARPLPPDALSAEAGRMAGELEQLHGGSVRPLSLSELCWLLATAHDPLAADLAVDRFGPDWAVPQHQIETWNTYQVGDFLHTTLRVRSWPGLPVAADFQLPLLLGGGRRQTYSLTMAPIPPQRSARSVRAVRTSHLSDESLRRRHGFLDSAQRAQERAAAEQLDEELALGHVEYEVVCNLTLSAPTRAELDRLVSETIASGQTCQVDLVTMPGEQRRAFTFTLPLARGLADS
jgi:hypothetical protein